MEKKRTFIITYGIISLILLLVGTATLYSGVINKENDQNQIDTKKNTPTIETISEGLKAIIYSALGGLLLALGQVVYKKGISYSQQKAIKKFWQLKKKKITIVHPMDHDDYGNPRKKSLARMEIISALHLLITFLRDQKIEYSIKPDFNELPSDTDIFLMSSPKGNQQSATFCNTFPSPFEIKQKDTTFYYRDRLSLVEYESPTDRTGDKADIGMISRITDFSGNRRIFLAWGIHIAGTLATVKFITNPKKLHALAKTTKSGDIAFLVQSTYINMTEEIIDVEDPKILTPINVIPEGQKWA